MRICVITGGPGIDPIAADIALSCDKVLCADSGADYAFENHIMPDTVYGDLDSISEEGKMRIDDLCIPVETFPIEKDMTDTELVLSRISKEDEIVLVCSLTGRIDHVMANLQIAMRMHKDGYSISVTDGITDVAPLTDGGYITFSGLIAPDDVVVSLIPNTGIVTGVTTDGLYYHLDNATITNGSSLSVSNKLESGREEFSVSVDKGDLFIVITSSYL